MSKSIRQMLQKSKYTVVLSGRGMSNESGYPAIRDGDESYDIEEKYGYSTEEIFSSAFYSTRKKQFYEFYRNELLSAINIEPGDGFKGLAKLEEMGLVDCVITRRMFSLSERAGCKKVINVHGTVFDNYCPHCGKEYQVEKVIEDRPIPLCDECSMPIRPRVSLYGEEVDNAVMTKAAEEVEKAELLLILGSPMNSAFCEKLVGYYQGEKIILVAPHPHFSDKYADIVIHKRVDEFMNELIPKLEKEIKEKKQKIE